MLRLYDPTEGTILVNDQDIKTLKLADLRDSIAVLFQDYTHFPLSVSPFRAELVGRWRDALVHDRSKTTLQWGTHGTRMMKPGFETQRG